METTFQNIAEIVEKKIETSNKDIFISDLFTDLGQFSKIDHFLEIFMLGALKFTTNHVITAFWGTSGNISSRKP